MLRDILYPPADMLSQALAGYRLPVFIIALFLVSCLAAFIAYKAQRKQFAVLGILLLAALGARLCLTRHFMMWTDEIFYSMVARDMLSMDVSYFGRPIGWPALISGIFALTGVDVDGQLLLGTVMGALAIPAVYLLALQVSRNRDTAIIAALLFCFDPLHMLWSSASETNIPALTFMLWGMAAGIGYMRDGDSKKLWASLLLLLLSSMIRTEGIMFLVIFAAVFVFMKRQPGPVLATAFCLLLFMPVFFPAARFYLLEKEYESLEDGSAYPGLITFPLYLLSMLISLPGVIIGPVAIYGATRMGRSRPLLMLVLISAAVFLFDAIIYPVNMRYGGEDRFLLGLLPLTYVSAAHAFTQRRLAAVAIMSLALFSLVSLHQANGQRVLQTYLPDALEEEYLGCLFIAAREELLAPAEGLDVVGFEEFIGSEEIRKRYEDADCALLYEDAYCTADFSVYHTLCRDVKSFHTWELEKTFEIEGGRIDLLRLTT